MPAHAVRRPLGRALALCSFLLAAPAAADEERDAALQQQIEALKQQNAELARALRALEAEVGAARDEARAARDAAGAPSAPAPGSSAPYGAAPAGASGDGGSAGPGRGGRDPLAQTSLGGARLQLLDLSLDTLFAFGLSTIDDEELPLFQGGGHDPRRRGFNLPQAELSFSGAVDPYFTGEAHLIYVLDPEGESRFELEEAFVQTLQLPFGLHERGVQLELGQFFTEFGRLNPRHPHQWDWQDQPVVSSRFFGEDGMRGTGARLGWLLPLPWYSELHLGAQNAQGETMVSFLANDEVFEERPIGGRPFGTEGLHDAGDLVYLMRWVNGGDLTDTWSAQVGVSGLYGANATGPDGETWIYGADWVLKWQPLISDRGWPFVRIEGEVMARSYRADSFSGCAEDVEDGEGCEDALALGSETLRDWGTWAQVLWGFRRPWAAGLRYEVAGGSGESVGPYDGRGGDPFRDDRHRLSPLLVFYPSEYSRIRLQYNYDRADFSAQSSNHTVWLGLEFGLGPHAAHAF
jgi:hypothetical protein